MVSKLPYTTKKSVPPLTKGYIADSGDLPPQAPATFQNNYYDEYNNNDDDDDDVNNRMNNEKNPINRSNARDIEHSLPTIEQMKTETLIRYGGRFKGGPSSSSTTGESTSSYSNGNNRYIDYFRRTTYDVSKSGRRRTQMLYCLAISATALILAACIAVLVSGVHLKLWHRYHSDISSESSNNVNIYNTDIDADKLNQMIDFLSTKISHRTDLETIGSPQNTAVKWMLQDTDYYSSVIPTDPNNYQSSYEFVQRYILAVMYYQMNGSQWFNDCSFLSHDKPVCAWQFTISDSTGTRPNWIYGIICNDQHEVTQILMPHNNVQGEFPAEMGDLLALEHLSMFDNHITGALPSRMSDLTDMQFMQFEMNSLNGTIPSWLNKLSKLEYLGLSNNNFTGPVPSSLGELSKLIEIDLSNNQLTGNIDVFDDSDCPENLKLIHFNNNNLTGRVHDASFYYCNSLQEIDLSDNLLTGYFPKHFYDYQIVNLEQNQLKGWIHNVTNILSPLEYLSLSGNAFSGTVPVSFSVLTSLKHLDLSDNQLTGVMSDTFDNFFNIEYLFLSKNNFEAGRLPYLKDATALKELSLAETNRTGYIPTWLGENKNLELLDLHGNQLLGTIPTQFGNLQSLVHLLLNGNDLTGQVPSSLNSVLSEAEMILLDHNSLTGTLDPVCDARAVTGMPFTSDCHPEEREISCKCCSICCKDSDPGCNKSVTEQLDRIKHSYPQNHYLYTENKIFRKIPSN